MTFRHWRLVLCVTAFLPACQAVPTRTSVADSELKGRLFFVGRDFTAGVEHGAGPRIPTTASRLLYEMPAAGGALTNRLPGYRDVGDLVWYPTSERLGFSNRDPTNRGWFLLNTLRTTGEAKPALRSASQAIQESSLIEGATHLVLSPDGARLVLLNHRGYLCVARRDTRDITLCEKDVEPCDDTMPAWSPDGHMIAFSGALTIGRSICALHELFVMDADTGKTWQVTGLVDASPTSDSTESIVKAGIKVDTSHKTRSPRWSPDGRWIAFTSPDGIGRVHPDGTGLAMIIKGADPAWSPDGSLIAYRAPRNFLPSGSRQSADGWSWTIYVSRADGSGEREVPLDPTNKLSVEDLVWTK
jgi:dipeptidyl aminopeptidase/acylaminoacyl peptidase